MLLTVAYGVLVIGAVCLAALAGLELVQRLVPAASRRPHNDVAGFIYAALGVIYAVLMALVVIAVWEVPDGQRDRRAGGQRRSRDLLARPQAPRVRRCPPPGARPLLRRGGRP